MTKPSIVAYLNPLCPWTRGVLQVLEKHRLEFEFRDIIDSAANFQEMVAKSGQHASPCIEIDGHMLADVGGEEVEAWLRARGMVSPAT
ncbi:glutaredoxin family protein [Candidatus Latescibacterota bacterium]